MKQKPFILLCNDDGIFSPGLAALCEAIGPFGDVLIVAPHKQQTSMGRSYPVGKDTGVIQNIPFVLDDGTEIEAYAVSGSPANCVAYGYLELCKRTPELCISGINYGENLGRTLTYSGTLGAALQAADFGIPSLAISRPVDLDQMNSSHYLTLDWALAKDAAAFWTQKVLREGMPFGAPILNINVPNALLPCEGIESFAYTFQSDLDMFQYQKPQARNFSAPFCLPSKKMDSVMQRAEKGSDIYTVCIEKRISVTPVCGNYTLPSFWSWEIEKT